VQPRSRARPEEHIHEANWLACQSMRSFVYAQTCFSYCAAGIPAANQWFTPTTEASIRSTGVVQGSDGTRDKSPSIVKSPFAASGTESDTEAVGDPGAPQKSVAKTFNAGAVPIP